MTPREIAAKLTMPQREVLLAMNPGPDWYHAPHAGCHRRQGAVARVLAEKGIFAWERRKGLMMFRWTERGRAVAAALLEAETP